MKQLIRLLPVLLACSAVVRADDWPAWRGATGQGYSNEKNLPLKWSVKDNVKWKVPLADPGNSTPVIWGDKIFLTQATKGGHTRSLLCFAKADGSLIWRKDITYEPEEKNWNPTWYANASPALEADRVYVCFASAGLYCYDFSGKELWKRTDLGKWEHDFGSGASPIIYNDLVIQWCGPNKGKGRNFLLAANKKTGETVWEHDEKYGSWSTPLVVKVNDQDQLLLGMSADVKGAPDPKTDHLKGFD
ncbi:MAG: PQQ-binding-like beta-propeller repeat protein, partial [Planctomycetia bacterium]|nr:PQQ-binding-like beta-propeller repeat protein [Planctomycetia bacterium]